VIDWNAVISDDCAVPDDLGGAVDELVLMLAAADPVVRDEQAYRVLATWIRRGVLDDRLAALGDTMAERLRHPEIQARTFAPLILDSLLDRDALLDRGLFHGDAVMRWLEAFTAWWPAEGDTRGWDEHLGWLHAVAHGADLAGSFGARLPPDDLPDLLATIARRVVAPTSYRYEQMEEDRVAEAAVRILRRPELTASAATGWLETVDELFATGEPGPLPVPVANTLAVLRATYVMADRHALHHRTAVTDAIAARLHLAFDAYPATRG